MAKKRSVPLWNECDPYVLYTIYLITEIFYDMTRRGHTYDYHILDSYLYFTPTP